MNLDQLSNMVLEHSKQMAALIESVKSSHVRHDNQEKIASSVHELARNIASIAAKIELLAEKMDKSIERIEYGQKVQGERIGAAERTILQVERTEKEILNLAEKLDKLRMEPGQKWKSLVIYIIGFLLASALGASYAGDFFR